MVPENFEVSGKSNWKTKPVFYLFAGILTLIPVIWIARTPLFYVCYLPLIPAAIFFTGLSKPRSDLPSRFKRLMLFISGLVICEIGYSILLVFRKELTFPMNKNWADWTVLAVELILGILVFLLFSGVSAGVHYFFRKTKSSA